ncbi:MAG: PEP-CTERM sorting domain-containing protein [Planctomycetes bacterium]|nr:PEP-CTERM sorting domain-containing protein [Planctomycetota bacterium]
MDIGISDKGHLDYLGGLTRVIDVALNATADLRGGSINYIKSMQYTTTLGIDPHIDLYVQPGWSWMSGDSLIGIEGLWQNGSPFTIEFINDEDYDPVWTNINVIEVPEPATLSLLGFGGLLIRKRR